MTTYQPLYVHTAAISSRRYQIRSRYLEKYLESQVDSLGYLGLYIADMDTSDTVKIYSIKKHYDGGGVDGHYEIKINPVTLTSADLYERYDLSAPIYKFDGHTGTGITMGMGKGSTGIRDLNDVASTLFNTSCVVRWSSRSRGLRTRGRRSRS